MVDDGLDARHILGRDPKSPSLFVGLDSSVEVNHAGLDPDVEEMSPGLILEFAHKLLADGAVVHAPGRFRAPGCKPTKQVAPRDDTNELAAADHRDALDPMPLECLH